MSGWRKRTIMEMALEAGLDIDAWEPLYKGGLAGFSVCAFTDVELERFAELVRADEREACAKRCDDLDDDLPDGLAGWQYGEAIRARGEQA